MGSRRRQGGYRHPQILPQANTSFPHETQVVVGNHFRLLDSQETPPPIG